MVNGAIYKRYSGTAVPSMSTSYRERYRTVMRATFRLRERDDRARARFVARAARRRA